MRRLAWLWVCALLPAHTFHYSKTEINWNTAAATLEIIATLHVDDIEVQLRKSHPQIEIDRDSEAERLLCAYVAAALELSARRHRCIGAKPGREFVDVFLELPVSAPPRTLRNRILIEDLPDQRNDVELKKDGKLLGPRIQFNSSETRRDLRW